MGVDTTRLRPGDVADHELYRVDPRAELRRRRGEVIGVVVAGLGERSPGLEGEAGGSAIVGVPGKAGELSGSTARLEAGSPCGEVVSDSALYGLAGQEG